MATLRKKDFQDLLTNYPRTPRVFFVAHETEDVVSSEWRVRGADGKEYKPDDYLTAFSEFVRENPAQVQAIGILLNRPQDWKPEVLNELRTKLAASPQRFTPEHLQKAHEIRYSKALVDIISMVKHAADEQSPLLIAAERVDRAFQNVVDGRSFTPEQQQWLDRIRDHLRENLSIDQEDFETLPVFTRFGGWGKVHSVFQGQLPELIKQFNQAIAA
jgi:type I restriction enzyme, R subunit